MQYFKKAMLKIWYSILSIILKTVKLKVSSLDLRGDTFLIIRQISLGKMCYCEEAEQLKIGMYSIFKEYG